ncbi:sodium:calcium antiporter [Patescibacteria group bacterium]|nr:sodium:calcium antiporter [Patescibacteria group bacterium]
MIIHLLTIVLASISLVKAAQWTINALVYLARRLRLSKFVIAFVLASFASSLPEFFVGISAALDQKSILSLSNVFGSNIANITLVLGLSVLLVKGLKIKTKTIQRNIIYTLLLLFYSVLLCLDGVLSRLDGVALLISFTLYNIILIYQNKDRRQIIEKAKKGETFYQILKFILSISLLLLSSKIIVETSQKLAETINIPLFIVGLLVIAVGTSLPELIFGLQAIRGKHKDMILGSLLGSTIVNSTAVIGLTAIIYPITIQENNLFLISVAFMLGTYILFAVFSRSHEKISWGEALILVFSYVTFIIVQFLIK